jgi:uncharacterized 2Fe-2S/4Fe-4S cluster protein (DUF4445 family)
MTRVRNALRHTHEVKDVEVTLDALRDLPTALRRGDWTVTAVLHEPSTGPALITSFRAGDELAVQYAVAVDVGTTTVDVSLIELTEGKTIAQASEYNAQVARGDDVITRVIAATKGDGLSELQVLVVQTISDLVEKCLAETGVAAADIIAYVTAGNTVMTHLLLGLSPASIRTSPYVPAASSFPWIMAVGLGLPGSHATLLTAIPCSASWLGGDIVAGIVACGMPWTDKLTLLVDVGTNGEIVLGNKEFMVACSCSAGPAFEGGGIRHGMRAADGAIEQVRLDDATLEPTLLTIGRVKPLGICGSGLIDLVSELFLTGAIDRNGTFVEPARSERVRMIDGHGEYVLVDADESGTGGDIVLTETDIGNLIRAKAAINAGINVLVDSIGLAIGDIDEVLVAGGFGRYLDIDRITALGMFPELPVSRYSFVGNSSLAGARLGVTSRKMLDRSHKVAEALTYLELSVNPGFMERYVSSLFLPHTDLAEFPATEALRARRSSVGAVI